MYLVELRPGKEELYRTGDELALAIRNGDVDARSRIYHRATAKWISITLHPQYKAIVAGQKDEPPARSARKGWGLLPGVLTTQSLESPSPDASPADGTVLQRWRRPIGLGFSGVMLILGIQLAFSGPRPPWAGRTRTMVTAPPKPRPVAADRQELVSLASTTTVWPVNPAPAPDTSTAPKVVAPLLPRAPTLKGKALGEALAPEAAQVVDANSIDALLSRYESANDSVRGRLETGMRVARLTRLFAASRLTPGGGVTDTRLSLAGAANFIRVYRQQQAAIEAAYQDSVMLLTKRNKWTPIEVKQWSTRPVRKEAPTLELLSGSLLAGIDSILGVLDAQAGAYKIRGTAIAFEDPKAAQAYGVLRRRIAEQISSAVAAGGATSPGPDRPSSFRQSERVPYRGRREPTASFRAISPGTSLIARSASPSSPRAISASRASRGETPSRRGPW